MRLVPAALVVVALAGCGHTTRSAGTRTGPIASDRGDPTVFECTVHTADVDLAVTFHYRGADAACREWISKAAKKGAYWTTRAAGSTFPALEPVCNVMKTFRGLGDVVVDVSAQPIGEPRAESICASFLAAGYADVVG